MSARSMLKKAGLGLALAGNVTLSVLAPAAQAQERVKAVTQYSYDANGRLVCTAVRMTRAAFNAQPDACQQSQAGATDPDRITKTEYDKGGRARQMRMGVGTSLEQAYSTSVYSDNGKVVDTIDAKGNRSHYSYDAYDRQEYWYFPNPTGPASFNPANADAAIAAADAGYNSNDFEQYGYDANNNRTDWRRRENPAVGVRMIGTIFDALNRPTTKNVWASADITTGYGYDYAYDNLGRVTSATEGSRQIVRTYDVRGLLSETTKQNGAALWTVSYAYDAAGRRDTITWPDGFNVKYDYYANSALKTLKRAGTDTLVTLTYDELDRRSKINRGNGVTTTYGYDPDSQRLSSLAQALPITYAADSVTFTFDYNLAGQITRRTIDNNTYVWKPTGLDKPYASNGLNQITKVGDPATAPTIAYDARGNLKSDGAATYLYDLENRLRGQGDATLAYDPLGRLFETQTGGTPNVVTRYVYDGPNVIAEYNGANVFQRRYVHGPGADEPLVQYMDSTPAPEYLLADHQGSVIAATGSTGAIATQTVGNTTVRKLLTYGEYGQAGLSNTGLFQYTGQIYLANLSLYHYKARAYSPVYGRFLQTDPTGYDDGPNWYAYVGNDPLNRSDPTGTVCWGNCPADADQIAIGGSIEPGKKFFAVNVNSETRGTWGIIGAAASMFVPGGQEVAAGRVAQAVKGEGAVVKALSSGADSVATAPKLRTALLMAEKAGASASQMASVMSGGGEAIIGAGTGRKLNDAGRLVAEYGGQKSDWAKIRSGSFTAQDGAKIETHAYRNTITGQTVEPKSIQVW